MPEARRERFIPFRKPDVVDACVARAGLADGDARSFRALCRILESVFHFEYHDRLEHLKACYAPANSDADTRPLRAYSESEESALHSEFLAQMKTLLDAANFEPITRRDLARSLDEAGLFRVRLHVDFDDFEDVLFFRRGEQVRRERVPTLFGLRQREIEFTNYERIAIYLRFKPRAYFEARERDELPFEPGSSLIKLFRNVPKADLEMLFPNSQVRMRTLDKLVIGVPAAVSGATLLVTKLGATLLLLGALAGFWLGVHSDPVSLDQGALVALGAGLVALGGFLWRQFTKFKNRKIRFMKALADNLYFKNLDNGEGVLHRLLDAAEEEEFKEAIVAYSFLLDGPPLRRAELDRDVEAWFRSELDCALDFDVSDALRKLERLGLAARAPDGAWSAVPLDEAKRRLDGRWDAYFEFEPADAGVPSAAAPAKPRSSV